MKGGRSLVKAPQRRLARAGEDWLGAVVFLCFRMPVDDFPKVYQYGQLGEEDGEETFWRFLLSRKRASGSHDEWRVEDQI